VNCAGQPPEGARATRLRLLLAAAAACTRLLSPACGADPAPAQPAGAESSPWSIHEQATWIDQAHPSFPSDYEGPNSLTAGGDAERTFSISLFLGYRILPGTEVYCEPEVFQGHGLSGTLGMA
jgi:hypothetical protein